ncbi:MAG: M3 family metallopeptidase, partial [Thermoproteota archaeon]|nr:M3 family metallopeptidase [Thermoproteota archaeon]
MNLKHWCELDDLIYISQTDEEYKQYTGLNYNEKLIEQLAQMKIKNSNIFIDFFSHPRSPLLGAIEDIAYSKTKKLELELHTARNTKITSSRHEFKDSPVNWSTWRQFNSLEKKPKNRKEVFDEFIEKTKYIAPIIDNRFSTIKQIYEENGYTNKDEKEGSNNSNNLDPVSAYLEHEHISYEKLVEFIKSMAQKAKKPFKDALTDIGKIILDGKEPEYYDDFYYFRNRAYFDIDSFFLAIEPLGKVKNIFMDMNFNMSRIHFDTKDRKDKYPSPICFFVKIPDDIRVLYKKESPYFDLQACFHETGHAMHASSIDTSNEYWDKYRIPMGITEIFSIFLERLTKNTRYISSLLGEIKDQNLIEKLISRNKFMELFFVTFYAANSLMKLEYWKENLSIEKASELYARLIKEYTGFEIPGEYWLLHHILPESIMYVPSYLLAAVRSAELDNYVSNKYGDKWWKEKDAGKDLKEIMKPGAKIDLSIFSKLDSNRFLQEITL